MDNNSLKQFVLEHRLRERTIDAFWKCFESYRKEEAEEFVEVFGEFDKDLLTFGFEKVTLTIRNWDEFEEDEYNENHEYVEAYLSLEYKDKSIGHYSLLFNFDGETFDDFFVLD